MSAGDQSEPTPRQPGAAVRLIFTYDGDDIRLLSRKRVEMLLPPANEPEAKEEQAGFWAEVRRDDGQVLLQKALHDPIRRDAEVFSDDPDRSISRAPLERPEGAFTVVIPDLEEADHIAFVGGEPGPLGVRAAERREIARFPLRPGTDGNGESQ